MRFLWRPYNRKPARADPFDPGQIKHDNILRARGLAAVADAANATRRVRVPGETIIIIAIKEESIGNIYRRGGRCRA